MHPYIVKAIMTEHMRDLSADTYDVRRIVERIAR
jgi:hypothetical protein